MHGQQNIKIQKKSRPRPQLGCCVREKKCI